MAKLTISEIEDYIKELKKERKLTIAGEYDPDPYGGGAHWDYEMRYNAESQLYVLQTNFYASQYNSEPEVTYTELDEQKVIELLLNENQHRVSCW